MAISSSESKMVGGVHPDQGLTKPLLSMAEQTDVGMAKVDLGLMMFTGL